MLNKENIILIGLNLVDKIPFQIEDNKVNNNWKIHIKFNITKEIKVKWENKELKLIF